jgi:hypothetical protein
MQSARLVVTAGCLCSHHPPTNPDYECVFVKDLSQILPKRSHGLWTFSHNEGKNKKVTSNEVGPEPPEIGAVKFEILANLIVLVLAILIIRTV